MHKLHDDKKIEVCFFIFSLLLGSTQGVFLLSTTQQVSSISYLQLYNLFNTRITFKVLKYIITNILNTIF